MKIILFILLVFIVCETKAQMLGVVASQSTTSVTPIIFDDFETGSVSASWTFNAGDVDSYTNFGITAPTDGGSYGIEFGSGERLYKIFGQYYEELWMWTDVRTGSAASRTYVGSLEDNNPTLALVQIRFTNATLPKLNIVILDPYVEWNSTQTFSPSTWYKVLVRCLLDGTDIIIQAWIDSGSGYVLVIDETNTNTNYINMGVAGSGLTGQTGYIDNFGIYESDPRN